MAEIALQQCISVDCGATLGIDEDRFSCPRCGSLLDVRYDWSKARIPVSLSFFDERAAAATGRRSPVDSSGVWRFRELLPFAPADQLVTIGEGRTLFQGADALAATQGVPAERLFLQYEGFNPSGSFKDNGMAAAFTMAKRLGRRRVACASTGNTSASMAMFARLTTAMDGEPMRAVVFVGGGKIAMGKLAQALDHGAITLQIDGDFDACMNLVREAAERLGLYLMNSVNPFRLEGQKTIMYRVLQELNWTPPDWIVVPGGNLGNCSAFGKTFSELKELGLIDRIPRLAVIQAEGANPFYALVERQGVKFSAGRYDASVVENYFSRRRREGRAAKTVATAIEIAQPVNLPKALRSLEVMNGVVRQVSDEEILDGKAMVGAFGFGCEPASGASVAGWKRLVEEGVISRGDRVVCILTGHALKDPDVTIGYHGEMDGHQVARTLANRPIRCPADVDRIEKIIGK